jgi:hypothetical protein
MESLLRQKKFLWKKIIWEYGCDLKIFTECGNWTININRPITWKGLLMVIGTVVH